MQSSFAIAVKRHLRTWWLGSDLRCFEVVDSTNRVARDAARSGAAEGTVVIADAQTRGRGRLGREWVSPPQRNLYVSVVLRPDLDADRLSLLSIMAGVAACDAVREWDPRALLKWPNDVLVEDRKIAGILTEAEQSERGKWSVILGIGVNLNSCEGDFPPELRGKAASLRMSTGEIIDRARFAACLLQRLELEYDRLRREGGAATRAAWWERSMVAGRSLTVAGLAGTLTGKALGLDEDGALRLQLDGGAERRVLAGDVTVVGIV